MTLWVLIIWAHLTSPYITTYGPFHSEVACMDVKFGLPEHLNGKCIPYAEKETHK